MNTPIAPKDRARSSRAAKIEALQEQLAASVAALVTGEDWKRALAFAARFRSRSFNNTMLIYAQHAAAHAEGRVPDPTPSYVAGFHQWQALGRQVDKGQHGYGILAPRTARFATRTPADAGSWRRLARNERPLPGETTRSRMIGVKPAYVWDISQTGGDPVPTIPRPVLLEGQAPAGLWDGLADQITAAGYDLRLVSSATVIGGANGLTDFLTREVSIRVDMDDAAQTKTLAHELGHVMLHAPLLNGTRPEPSAASAAASSTGLFSTGLFSTGQAAAATLHRGLAEVEAESIALMVGAAHGLDTRTYTIPYVTTWAASVPNKTPVEVVHATADRVRAASIAILTKLNTRQIGDGNPPGIAPQTLSQPSQEPPSTTVAQRDEAVLGR